MYIREFLENQRARASWLEEQKSQLESADHYFASWPHPDGIGFGLVITAGLDPGSGELHLMRDGSVTYHIEIQNTSGGKTFFEDEKCKTPNFHDFEVVYNRFRDQITKSGV